MDEAHRRQSELTKEFNSLRENFVKSVDRYYRQGFQSNYVTEDELIDMLTTLKSLREQRIENSKAIRKRRPTMPTARFNP
jgi:hypothetical protein